MNDDIDEKLRALIKQGVKVDEKTAIALLRSWMIDAAPPSEVVQVGAVRRVDDTTIEVDMYFQRPGR